MKHQNIAALIGAVFAFGPTTTALAADAANVKLEKLAKVSEADARATALAKVPGGSVQSAELEEEGGKLVWSFDISRPKMRSIVEVLVDAKTGVIVSRKNESPAEQAKEAKADKLAKP